ncbi:MAG: Gfo/Idh/MocA family oxidoreductase [Fuerstiella sp.]
MTTFSRRSFLKASSAAGLSAGLFANGSPAAASRNPLEKLNIACIGTANRAAVNIDGVKGENLVAFCDVDSVYLDRAIKTRKEATGNVPGAYADYREMIDSEAENIDAVVVATTDHHHAPATIRAINAGKHVYCEKPLTHTVQEARIITDAARKAGVATQLGTQIHAGANYRRVSEIVQSGALGDINEVHVWVGKGWGITELKNKAETPPKHFNWDLWLGAAAERPYVPGRYHPGQWRRWWDFGQGTLGDMGCHYMDLPFWALNLKYPTSVKATGAEPDPDMAPVGLVVEYQFPELNGRKACSLTWSDGNKIPKTVAGQKVPANGVMFVGSKGSMFADYSRYRLFPKDKFVDFEPPAQTIPDSIGHHAEWIQACKTGSPTTCNFDYSGPLSETVLLGNIAYRSQTQIQWNGEECKVTNSDQANELTSKQYRSGWEVEAK